MNKQHVLILTLLLTLFLSEPTGAALSPPPAKGIHICGVTDGHSRFGRYSKHPLSNRHYARSAAANLNVGPPRTVRLIYFLPNDRPYQAEVVQRMKNEIRTVQTFFAESMEARGYGRTTFAVETDAHGEPVVHRVDGRYPDSHYLDYTAIVYDELKEMFNYDVNIYLTVVDNSTALIDRQFGGTGGRWTKQGGEALVTRGLGWDLVAHELGHAFGLMHDFRDGAYVMSYGSASDYRRQVSQCHADFLSVHSYFNPDTPVIEVDTPAIRLISPRVYSAGAKRVPIHIEVSDFDGLHQLVLHAAQPDNRWSVKGCRQLGGKRDAVITFDYDGVIPSAHDPSYSISTSLKNPLIHPIVIEAIDMNGDVDSSLGGDPFRFVLFSETAQPLTKISGDNQHGLPNRPLPVPLTVELWDLNEGFARGEVTVRFTVTAGGGSLSQERTETDWRGRAETILTLGPHLGENRVEASVEGMTVTFTAVAGAPVAIPDKNLRAAVENALSKMPGQPIAPADMASLTRLEARNANISDLTGLQHAINLTDLTLGAEWVEGEGAINSNSITDISALAALTNLTSLDLGNNSVSDISALAGLTNLTWLELTGNSISNIAPIASLTKMTHLDLDGNAISNILPLAGLTNLTWLDIWGTPISDISPLAGLTNLTTLGLGHNNISDISPVAGLTSLTGLYLPSNYITDISSLSGLTNLKTLWLNHNNISDLSPLVANTGLGDGDEVNVRGNPLSYQSVYSHIPVLQSRGVTIEFDSRTPAILLKLLGDNQESAPSTILEQPLAVEVQDQKGEAFAGVPVRFTVTAGAGSLSQERTETDGSGVAESLLTLGAHLGINTVEVSAAGMTVTFTAEAVAAVEIPDPNLRAVVENTLSKAQGQSIVPAEMARLTELQAPNANISDLTGLEHAINLRNLNLSRELVDGNWINSNAVSDLSPLSDLTRLTHLWLEGNAITDISPVTGLVNLVVLHLGGNTITDISPVTGLVNLTKLVFWYNDVTDISVLAGLTNLETLYLDGNPISDISVLAGLTNLTRLGLEWISVSDFSPLAELTNLKRVDLRHNDISDISPLVANTGLGSGDEVDVRGNPLSYQSIHTHIPALQDRGVMVEYDNRTPATPLKISGDNQLGVPGTILEQPFVVEVRDQNARAFARVPVVFSVSAGGGALSPEMTTTDANGRAESMLTLGPNPGTNTVEVSVEGITDMLTFNALAKQLEFDLFVPTGISLIHVPLKVTTVDGVAKPITAIADLYDALGGASSVTFLVTFDAHAQKWHSYLGASDTGTAADKELTDDLGVIVSMKASVSIRLSGKPLGTDGSSAIALNQGLNLVGLPLRDARINRVSDLLRLDGIWGNVSVITLNDRGTFKTVGRAGDPGDIPITGGQSFILIAQRAATVDIFGEGWTHDAATVAAPVSRTGIGNTTPVLAVSGSVVDEVDGMNRGAFRVSVKNLSNRVVTSHSAAAAVDDVGGYRLTIVDVESARAAGVGDLLEVTAQTTDPFIGVKPVRYTVTAEDVKLSLIQLPNLIAYEIPTETALLANYPNPFNPETWIPYRLAEDAFVTLTIYDGTGLVVRSLDVGHRVAAVYESREKAIYFDGRNNMGETVASGVYFYTLTTGEYAKTRKMLILK